MDNTARAVGVLGLRSILQCGALTAILLLSACSGSTPTTYHTLGAVTVPSADAKANTALLSQRIASLGVGPVRVPALLDRRGVVLRQDQYTVEVSELHEWGGELEDEFVSTLAQQLQVRLPKTEVRTVPWELEQTPRYQVTVTVAQFDGMPAGKAVLRGRWQLQLAKTGRGVSASQFLLEQDVAGDSIKAIVRAQSQLVNDLAEHILAGFK